MKKTGVLLLMILASQAWTQIPDSFVFSDPDNRQPSSTSQPVFRDITPSHPFEPDPALSPYMNAETVIAETFFRSIWSGINRRSAYRTSRMQARFNFTNDEEQVLNIFLSDWQNKTSEKAHYSIIKMCDYWAQPGLTKNYETALAALDVRTSHRPTIEAITLDIQELLANIEQRMGSDMADLLVTELDKDLRTRSASVGYQTMESIARARGNALEQVKMACTP